MVEQQVRTPGLPAQLTALLVDLDALRLILATDLELAASAVDAGVPALAAEALQADREELACFERRSLHRLAAPPSDAAGAPAAPAPARLGRPSPRRDRARRRLLPAAPALAAAALIGILGALLPAVDGLRDRVTVPAGAATSYATLARLRADGAGPADLRAAALELHAQVQRLLPAVTDNPAAAREALSLLELEAALLGGTEHRGQLDEVLAESLRLWRLLHAALARVAPTPANPLPTASLQPDRTGPAALRSTEAPAPGSGPAAEPAPSARPGPQVEPTAAAPAAGPSTPPAAGPSAGPAAGPSAGPLLPSAGGSSASPAGISLSGQRPGISPG